MKRAALLVLRFYQRALSPYARAQCRFLPPCSRYSYGAIERHGFLKGGWFTMRRLARCHPLGGSGYDPVP